MRWDRWDRGLGGGMMPFFNPHTSSIIHHPFTHHPSPHLPLLSPLTPPHPTYHCYHHSPHLPLLSPLTPPPGGRGPIHHGERSRRNAYPGRRRKGRSSRSRPQTCQRSRGNQTRHRGEGREVGWAGWCGWGGVGWMGVYIVVPSQQANKRVGEGGKGETRTCSAQIFF